jgi:murein DD-endopeptidase MepM/ murein hydrolase activator NlpD
MPARKLLFVFLSSLILLFGLNPDVANADTTPYRSAGWVGSSGDTPFINLGNCQKTDGEYCVRPSAQKLSALYFGSFPDLESFRIPLDSVINGVRIRISGKSGGIMYVGIDDRYNQMPARSTCQKPFDRINLYLGPNGSTSELNFTLNSINGLVNCISLNNINFRNLTFHIAPLLTNVSSTWFSEIDNFEIAFDYTPPAITPTPLEFSADQNGTVWEIGPDRSNLEQVKTIKDVTSVSTWDFHSLALKSDGTVWAWGRNSSGELGNGNTIDSDEPVQVIGPNGEGFLTDIKAIAAGDKYSLALRNDGTIWTWGDNSSRLRGVGSNPEVKLLFPVQVKSGFFSDVASIAAGGLHSLALNSDGTIVAWGSNNVGQLGSGCSNCSIQLTPVRTKNISNVKAISAGRSHSLALKNDGTVWGWGRSSLWELSESGLIVGDGETILPIHITELSDIKAISSKYHYNLAINNLGKVFEWGEEFRLRAPKEVAGISDAVRISAGRSSFSFGVMGYVIKEDGTLWEIYVNDTSSKLINLPKKVISVTSGGYTPALAVVNTTGDVLGDSTIKPFLDLPWDYENKENIQGRKKRTFSDAALEINSFFDHQYPLLGVGLDLDEPSDATDSAVSFMGFPQKKIPELWYSSHDGFDYGTDAGVHDGDSVYPAASGSAAYEYDSAGGHTILVDHLNGYQTRYYHLQKIGLITSKANEKVDVTRNTSIGKVGSTGSHTTGSHIHMGVFQDKNKDGNFEDNEPDGATDPFGWMPFTEQSEKVPDPWEIYAFFYKGQERTGNKSNYLWKNKIEGLKESLTEVGGEYAIENYTINFPPDLQLDGLKLDAQLEPGVNASDKIFAIGPGIRIILKDTFGKNITKLNKKLRITIAFTDDDIEKFKKDSLAVYSSNDLKIWRKEDSEFDWQNAKVTIAVDHLTHFALMGERIDTTAPATTVRISGLEGHPGYFRSPAEVALVAEDNEGGLGIETTHYKTENTDWQTYQDPLVITEQGKQKIYFYSVDRDRNVEEVKSKEFTIDTIPPSSSSTIEGEEGENGWYVSSVSVKLTSNDSESGVSKTEYSLDDGSTYQEYNTGINIVEEGIRDIYYRSFDKAGNIEEASLVTIKIDKTPPNSIVYTSGQRGQDNWYRSNVSVAINGNDDVSGYKTSYVSLDNGESYTEYVEPVILSEEKKHRVHYYSVDNAGNKEDEEVLEVNIDKTPPSVAVDAMPNSLWPANGKLVNIRVNGKSTDENIYKTEFGVEDEYGLVEPRLIAFGQDIRLEAKRKGDDLDGRLYTIQALAEDLSGNRSAATANVVVPHDQRR